MVKAPFCCSVKLNVALVNWMEDEMDGWIHRVDELELGRGCC